MDKESNDNIIHVKKGQIFEIKLSGVPTSGFTWDFSIPKSSDKLISHLDTLWEYNKSLVGGQSLQIFRFLAVSVGNFLLTFFYRRPWEQNKVLDEKIYAIHIVDEI